MGVSFAGLLAFLALIAWGLRQNQAGPIAIGEKAPAFSLTTFDGKVLKTADYSGKVVVINFWASWCQPCEQEAPALEQAWQVYKQAVRWYSWAWITSTSSRRPWRL